ncbi:MAG: tetratricopeptide repeat protein, partial [Gammaproteobacteria bacterium]|nr:tetratricopeptide repeat protein [Gammaproteobacteria bacterium]
MGKKSRSKRVHQRGAEARPLRAWEQEFLRPAHGPDGLPAATARVYAAAPLAVPIPGGRASEVADDWYVAEGKRGQRLLDAGRVDEATTLFESILVRLGNAPGFGRAVILGRLARCLHVHGKLELAVSRLREALELSARLAPSTGVRSLCGTLHSELGDALAASARHGEAREAYAAALEIARELGDRRGQGVDLAHLGEVALAQGEFAEALERYEAARDVFQQLGEGAQEAITWQQMGRLFEARQQWDDAERHYSEAARISEQHGNLKKVASICHKLGGLSEQRGRPKAAERWYRKAIDADRGCGDRTRLARHLGSLARLLRDAAGRPVEARQLAEEALAVAQALDPAVADFWHGYGRLADML